MVNLHLEIDGAGLSTYCGLLVDNRRKCDDHHQAEEKHERDRSFVRVLSRVHRWYVFFKNKKGDRACSKRHSGQQKSGERSQKDHHHDPEKRLNRS